MLCLYDASKVALRWRPRHTIRTCMRSSIAVIIPCIVVKMLHLYDAGKVALRWWPTSTVHTCVRSSIAVIIPSVVVKTTLGLPIVVVISWQAHVTLIRWKWQLRCKCHFYWAFSCCADTKYTCLITMWVNKCLLRVYNPSLDRIRSAFLLLTIKHQRTLHLALNGERTKQYIYIMHNLRNLSNCTYWDVVGQGTCSNVSFTRQLFYCGLKLLNGEIPSG